MLPANWIASAEERLSGRINLTPVSFEKQINSFIKWENKQKTGSFKIRGALNKILQLTPEEIQHGLATVSSGNHGLAAATGAAIIGAKIRVFAPDFISQEKVEAIQKFGAEVSLVDGGYGEAERTAIEFSKINQKIWISPYNDGQVIAGQGTLGLEITRQIDLNVIDQIVFPIGGGGLAAGIGASMEGLSSHPKLIGVQSSASPYFYQEYHSHTQTNIREEETLAEGLAGPLEQGSITIPLVHHYLDDILLVTEEEIGQAIVFAWDNWKEKIEGSGAVPLAAILSGKLGNKKSVLIFSGGNIDPELFSVVCRKWNSKTLQRIKE